MSESILIVVGGVVTITAGVLFIIFRSPYSIANSATMRRRFGVLGERIAKAGSTRSVRNFGIACIVLGAVIALVGVGRLFA
jgi:hypothetical protein